MTIATCESIIDNNNHELTRHGSISFPVAAYDDDLSVNNLAWHWHEELEAAFVTQGSGVIGVCADKIELKEGEGIFINSGAIHSAHSTGKNFRVRALVFHADLISGNKISVFHEKYLAPLMRSSKFIHIQSSDKSLEALFRAWTHYEQAEGGFEFFVREELSRFILSLCENICEPEKISLSEQRSIERVKLMLNFIHEHFAENIDSRLIASSASISESECLRCFHKVLGTTPGRYLRDYRLRNAEKLLLSTDINIADIAGMCGFGDESYFARIFKGEKQITPSEFRK